MICKDPQVLKTPPFPSVAFCLKLLNTSMVFLPGVTGCRSTTVRILLSHLSVRRAQSSLRPGDEGKEKERSERGQDDGGRQGDWDPFGNGHVHIRLSIYGVQEGKCLPGLLSAQDMSTAWSSTQSIDRSFRQSSFHQSVN